MTPQKKRGEHGVEVTGELEVVTACEASVEVGGRSFFAQLEELAKLAGRTVETIGKVRITVESFEPPMIEWRSVVIVALGKAVYDNREGLKKVGFRWNPQAPSPFDARKDGRWEKGGTPDGVEASIKALKFRFPNLGFEAKEGTDGR